MFANIIRISVVLPSFLLLTSCGIDNWFNSWGKGENEGGTNENGQDNIVDTAGESSCSPADGTVYSTNDMDFICVPSGTFVMGSPETENYRYDWEVQHEVTLTNDFLIARTEVTEAQFMALVDYAEVNDNECGSDCPMENLTWDQAAAFTNALSSFDGLPTCYECIGSGVDTECQDLTDPYGCEGYRLPTEAEWEYAARAGTTSAFSNGGNVPPTASIDDNDSCLGDFALDNGTYLDQIAWYCGNSEQYETEGYIQHFKHPVAQLEPNPWGLYDMHGNVWEFTNDWYHEDLITEPTTNPTGPSEADPNVDWEDEGGCGKLKKGGGAYQGNGDVRAQRSAYKQAAVQKWVRGIRVVRTFNNGG